MTDIRWREQAEDDLFGIWQYIAAFDPAAADRYINGLRASVRRLADHPQSGSPRSQYGVGIRSIVHRKHVSFYIVDNGTAEIIRVLHAAQDHAVIFQSS